MMWILDIVGFFTLVAFRHKYLQQDNIKLLQLSGKYVDMLNMLNIRNLQTCHQLQAQCMKIKWELLTGETVWKQFIDQYVDWWIYIVMMSWLAVRPGWNNLADSAERMYFCSVITLYGDRNAEWKSARDADAEAHWQSCFFFEAWYSKMQREMTGAALCCTSSLELPKIGDRLQNQETPSSLCSSDTNTFSFLNVSWKG